MSKKLYLSIILIFFSVLYASISLVNHYFFRTNTLDLGAYTNALYDYSHGHWSDTSTFGHESKNLLADHFDLYLILLSPLSFIFGTYTLLIVQIIALIVGGWGVYSFFESQPSARKFSLFALCYFLVFFGVFSAVAFDYHSNAIAACIVPWLFYFIWKQNYWKSAILILLIIVSKENMSLWVIFICLGLAIEFYKNKKTRYFLLIFSFVSLLYFIGIVKIVMPALSNQGTYPHFHYSVLGNNFSEAIVFLATHPWQSIKLLFVNHLANSMGDSIKMETDLFLLCSGLPILFFRPQYFFMLLPIFFQKMYHNNIYIWSVTYQYSIEFAPILAIGIFVILSHIKNVRIQFVFASAILLGTLITTIRLMDNTQIYTNKKAIRIYEKAHYSREFNVQKLHTELESIPEDAIVCAQSSFLPHLSLREKIYPFPIIKDAQYVIYSTQESPYPLTEEELHKFDSQIILNPNWMLIYEDGVKIYKRKS